MGIRVLGPDINESYYKFNVNEDKAIRFRMGAIKGVGKGAVETIVENRKDGNSIPELITNNETGILVPPNNPELLLKNINELLEDEKKASKLSDKAHEFVIKNLTWEILLPKYIKFYEDLLKS